MSKTNTPSALDDFINNTPGAREYIKKNQKNHLGIDANTLLQAILAERAKKSSSKEEKKNQSVKIETSSSKEEERIVAIEKDIKNIKANVEEIVSFIRKVKELANQQ